MSGALIEARNLVKDFPVASGSFGQRKALVHAVSDVSFDIRAGETFALVGESGCGKSTIGRLLLNLIEPTCGEVVFDGREIGKLSGAQFNELRREMQIIFQDPYSALNPRMSIQQIIAEPMVNYRLCAGRKELSERVQELLRRVGIRPEFMNRYPHQFSGGQRQRIGIARALALNPRFVVCDEPVSALDVSIQSQILNLLGELQQEHKLTYLFISHDLSVVRYLSDRVCVMFLGKMCECGDTRHVYDDPKHPYTRFLLEAVPKPDPDLRKEAKEMLRGEIPSPINPPPGCRFHTRCPYAMDRCREQEPAMRGVSGRLVACHLY